MLREGRERRGVRDLYPCTSLTGGRVLQHPPMSGVAVSCDLLGSRHTGVRPAPHLPGRPTVSSHSGKTPINDDVGHFGYSELSELPGHTQCTEFEDLRKSCRPGKHDAHPNMKDEYL